MDQETKEYIQKILNTTRKRLLNVRETATTMGISEQTIYNGISKNAKDPFPITPIRVGKKPMFDVEDIDSWIQTQKGAA